jgi:molecular chaperone DnaK
MYALGIDLGTTFTAAALWRDGRAEISSLGNRSAAIPSVVVLREDSTFITGESANRQASLTPNRVAREFKRRLGDTTPILLGGVPYSAEALMGRLLRAVVDEVSTREGGPPGAICVCHPANWGPYKTDLLQQAVRIADLENTSLSTEPEAAAVFYAGQQRMADGAVVAVYDLGGGTFDAAVLRRTGDGFEILGRPEGIERLGGLDFDAAIFAHVSEALGDALLTLDEEDPATITAVARLRDECTEAKEALSSDTETTIPVLLPNLNTKVRLTRDELEDMVRPALEDSIGALRRALRSAGVTPEQLDSVLLVGGSSRMPVVAQLVATELGRPVAVDAHPKHAVALGAARLAGAALPAQATTETIPAQAATETIPAQPATEIHPAPPARRRVPDGQPPRRPPITRTRTIGILIAVLIGLGVAGFVLLRPDGDQSPKSGPAVVAGGAREPTCGNEIKANPRWVCLTDATLTGGILTIKYDAEFAGSGPSIRDGYHLNVYGGDGVTPADSIEGRQSLNPGHWYEVDRSPSVLKTSSKQYLDAIGDATKVCARIATKEGVLVKDLRGTFVTGNCIAIKRT